MTTSSNPSPWGSSWRECELRSAAECLLTPASRSRPGKSALICIARRAFRGSEELQLAPREFELLTILMRNAGAVLTRETLLSRVWGSDYLGDPRTVDVHIRWLREKIELDPSRPTYLQTVRGSGYRFEAW